MEKAEFDKFAEEYRNLHQKNIKVSGEPPEYFAEYKIIDVANIIKGHGLPESMNILDFGSGVGNSVPFFKKHIPGANLTCLDISAKSLRLARERFPNQAEFVVFDGDIIPFKDNCFEIVFSACVFHHIPQQEFVHLFGQLFKLLKPGGLMIIFEHNPYNPLTVRAVNTCPFDENAKLISAPTLVKRIKQGGFHNVYKKYRIFIPGKMRFFRPLEANLGWLPLGAQYYIVARK